MQPMSIGLYSSIAAFVLYILGGIAIFSGLALVIFLNGHDLFGLGDARPIGYLFLCIGGCLSVLGVLLLRVVRIRVDRLLSSRAHREEACADLG